MAENNVGPELIKEIKELRKAIDGLKNVIAELRASITDLTSPYAPLKSIPSTPSPSVKAQKASTETSKPPSESLEEKPAPKAIKMEAPSKPHPPSQPSKKQMEESHPMRESPTPHKEVFHEKEKKTVSLEELREVLRELGDVIKEEEKKTIKPKLDVRRVIHILKTIYNLRKALPKESIDNIIKLVEILGLITPSDKEVLEIIGSLVEDALKQNLTPDEQVLLLYVLLKNLGYIDGVLEEEILKIVSDVITSKKKVAATVENTSMKTKGGSPGNLSSSK